MTSPPSSRSPPGHGVKIFDLTQLRGLEATTAPSPPDFSGAYPVDGTAHNVVSEEETDMTYLVGSGQVLGYGACTLESVSTDNAAGVLLSRAEADEYPEVAYSHQGWMSEDQQFYFHGDELDEQDHGLTTRTFVFDIRDLDDIGLHFVKYHGSTNIDHNMYTHGGLLYQSNYTAGLEVFDTTGVADGGCCGWRSSTPTRSRPPTPSSPAPGRTTRTSTPAPSP